MRPITIALPIADRHRSYAFYQQALSLEPVGEPPEDGVPEPLQFRLAEGVCLMLIPSGGFGWVIGDREITPTGVSAIVARMRDGGGQILAVPTQQDWGFTAVVTDPDGHAWQIIAESAES